MPKMIFLCVSNEATATCPCCGHLLNYRDSRRRVFRVHGGGKSYILIRRLKCSHCKRHHTELPDILSPYKHYTAEVIENVVDGIVDTDTPETEDYPCEATMKRWHEWIRRNILNIDGSLKSVGYRMLDFSERFLKSGVSLLRELRNIGAGWLSAVNRVIHNSGGFLPV